MLRSVPVTKKVIERTTQLCATPNLQTSTKKLNPIANLIAKLPVDQALIQLKFLRKKNALPTAKALLQGIDSASKQLNFDRKKLYIKEAWVGKAFTLKRINIMGKGNASIKQKRHAHLKMVLAEKPAQEPLKGKVARMKRSDWVPLRDDKPVYTPRALYDDWYQ